MSRDDVILYYNVIPSSPRRNQSTPLSGAGIAPRGSVVPIFFLIYFSGC